jgi:hypothetical protein
MGFSLTAGAADRLAASSPALPCHRKPLGLVLATRVSALFAVQQRRRDVAIAGCVPFRSPLNIYLELDRLTRGRRNVS